MKHALALLASLAVATATFAASPTLPGVAVGAKAPDFTLKNAAGADVSLMSLTKQGPVALVFYRSADWCPFCKKQLQALQADLAKVEMSGVRVVGISYDAPATSAAAAAKLGLTFPLLSDTGSKVIDAYGIRNAEAKGKAAGVAHPVVFIVDQKGVIRAKLGRDGYKDRPESAEIIAAAKGL
ncbi:MAG: peroxiredoxin family protein [Opitutaceae bacterium]|nr:peroxiredoxin family protein [Opitutaceae bacterium]